MKKNTLLAVVLFLIGGLAYLVPAAAQMQQGPWYAGVSFGQSRAQDVCRDAALFGGRAGCDSKDVSWGLMGGYQVNRSFALEAGYRDLGKASVPGTSIKANAWELLGVGFLPLGQVSLLGKLGFMRGRATCEGCAAQTEEVSTNMTWGAGLQFDLSPKVALRGEWQRYNNLGGGQFNAKYDVDAWSLGAQYRF